MTILGRHAVHLLLCMLALLGPISVRAVAIEPRQVSVLVGSDKAPPGMGDARWQPTSLPDVRTADVVWYRVEFEIEPALATDYWVLYLPYLYGGGRIWLNGEPLAAVPESSQVLRVRRERPLLLPLPASMLHAGKKNVLHLRAVPAYTHRGTGAPRLVVGTQDELQPKFERRLFFMRTLPLVTLVMGSVVGLLVIFVWLRRRQEVLYGLFGLAAVLWAARTTNLLVDALPVSVWPAWRLLYHATNGGFVICMTLFALSLAGWLRPAVARALAAYAALGPVLYLVAGSQAETLVARWWTAGLIPIGLSIVVVSAAAAWRQRTPGTVAIAVAVSLAVGAGAHDYFIAWNAPRIEALSGWIGHRIFLLHYGANLLLVVMGVLLTLRFVSSLREAEDARRTLEARVAERESEIAANYQRIAVLQQRQAATDERHRIMQDLHDGLGSQLFTSLMRAERGALDNEAMADTLRSSIEEMRLAIEALASDEQDIRTAFGNFCFRWEPRLREAGVIPSWDIDLPDAVPVVPAHDALQLLRIAQEALTNVLKHARATRVRVGLSQNAGRLVLEVQDDGCGSDAPASGSGRGQANMRARAMRLGAELDIAAITRGLRVRLVLPLAPG